MPKATGNQGWGWGVKAVSPSPGYKGDVLSVENSLVLVFITAITILNIICDKMLLLQGLTAPTTQSWDATNPKRTSLEPVPELLLGTLSSPKAQP